MDQFVNREDELSRLRDCYESDDADMVVIFGRRRLGKTELVRESLLNPDDAVLYQATETTRRIQLDAFVDEAAEAFPGIDRIENEWESLLGYLADQDAVIVLDEFPYLIDADESLPSVIQRLWDQELRDTGVTLVLVGSSISMMEEATLLGNSPCMAESPRRLISQTRFCCRPDVLSREQYARTTPVRLGCVWWDAILFGRHRSRC